MTNEIKSIFILTLVTRTHYNSGSIMGDVLWVLESIATILDSANQTPRIDNPVNTGEDLAAHLTDYSEVRSFFLELNDKLTNAIADDDEAALREIFGPGFDYEVEAKSEDYATAATAIVAPIPAFGVVNGTIDD